MGASERADGGVGVDCGVGSIVWVRRRNGSWWPGRILAQDELAASQLLSPRSGTPVKLLGREDASVDWYNLEKSKRVKAFRCGEFATCIERVESSQDVLPKKREKYARREDAILHALDLEKQLKSGVTTRRPSHKYSVDPKKDLNRHSSYEAHLKDNESIDFAKSGDPKPQSHSQADLPSEEVSGSSLLNAQQCESGKQMYLENDNSEAMPRMRGLQDFGLCTAPFDRKASMPVACESTKAGSVNNHVDAKLPDSVLCVGSANSVGGGKSPAADKRKRSCGSLTEEYLAKRRDRRRPLVQVLQNSSKLPAVHSWVADWESASVPGQEEMEHIGTICHINRSRCMCSPADSDDCLDHAGCSSDQMQISPTQVRCRDGLHQPGPLAVEDTSSGLIKDNDTGSSERDSVDVFVDDGTTLLQDYTSFVPGSTNSGNYFRQDISILSKQEKIGKISNEYETSISGCKAILLSHDKAAGTVDMGVSKWHMKGKRNTRNTTKRSIEVLNGKNAVMSIDNRNGYLNGSVYEGKKRGIYKIGQENSCGQGFDDKDGVLNYAYEEEEEDDDNFFKENLKNQLVGFGKHRCLSMTTAASRDHPVCGVTHTDDDSHEMFLPVLEANEAHPLSLTPYWVESDELLDKPFVRPLNVEMELPLVDVNLKVQASCHGEHVPLVSLMSRLNGKAIIGHPVHIDILEDGSADLLFPRNAKRQDAKGVAEYATPPHVWRTGRRTAMQRVPRPHPAASALESEEVELIPYSDRENRPLFKKQCTASIHETDSFKCSSDHSRLTPGKPHKKLSKKGSLSSHKTRRLSSIAVEKKRSSTGISTKHGRSRDGVVDGLIKPGGTMPLVTCVPVKVVFSRLLEAVGRPVSASKTRWAEHSGLSVRNPP